MFYFCIYYIKYIFKILKQKNLNKAQPWPTWKVGLGRAVHSKIKKSSAQSSPPQTWAWAGLGLNIGGPRQARAMLGRADPLDISI